LRLDDKYWQTRVFAVLRSAMCIGLHFTANETDAGSDVNKADDKKCEAVIFDLRRRRRRIHGNVYELWRTVVADFIPT